jgi:alpha/beta hydrolase family protein
MRLLGQVVRHTHWWQEVPGLCKTPCKRCGGRAEAVCYYQYAAMRPSPCRFSSYVNTSIPTVLFVHVSRTGKAPAKRVVYAGRSMGCRVAAAAAAAADSPFPPSGLLFFSYPLHPPGKRGVLRDRPLLETEFPVMFVVGEKDPFVTPLGDLEKVWAWQGSLSLRANNRPCRSCLPSVHLVSQFLSVHVDIVGGCTAVVAVSRFPLSRTRLLTR